MKTPCVSSDCNIRIKYHQIPFTFINLKIREKPCVVLNFEARCVVNKIHEYFFLKGCDIVWVGVFRLQYHGFHFSGHFKSLDRVFEREIEKSSAI